MKLKQLTKYMMARGLILGGLALEVDKLEAVPEAQRGWYAAGDDGKFKLDLAKVEVEDTASLKAHIKSLNEENAKRRNEAKTAVAEALKAYEGIDPVKTRQLLSRFQDEEEKELIANNQFDEVISRRMEKQREALHAEVDAAKQAQEGALEVAQSFMDRVLENHVRQAAMGKLYPSAVKDAILHARDVFSLNEAGEAVQLDANDEPVLGKDGKKPFTLEEWVEERRVDCPHWFPATGSGGGAPGDRGVRGKQDLSGLTPQQRMTMARAGKI